MNAETWFAEMYVSVLEMKCRVWECHWQWHTALSQRSMDKVDDVSLREFACLCIWDRMWWIVHTVWCVLFLRSHWVFEVPKKVICARCTFSWRCLAPGMAQFAWMIFDEFWGFNTKLYWWIWSWTTFELCLEQKNVVQSIAFAKHAVGLTSFGTSVC